MSWWRSTKRSTKLAAESPEKAKLVKLRYFAGLTHRRGGQCAGHLARNGRSPLGLREGVAALRNGGCRNPNKIIRRGVRQIWEILALSIEARETDRGI